MDKKQCIKNNYSLNKINNKKNKNNNKKHKGNFDYKYNLYNDYKCKIMWKIYYIIIIYHHYVMKFLKWIN